MTAVPKSFEVAPILVALVVLAGPLHGHASMVQSSTSGTTTSGINTNTLNSGYTSYYGTNSYQTYDPNLDSSYRSFSSSLSNAQSLVSSQGAVWVEAGKLVGSLFGLFTENSFTDQLETLLASLFVTPLENRFKDQSLVRNPTGQIEQAIAQQLARRGSGSGIQGRVLSDCNPYSQFRQNSTQDVFHWVNGQGS